MSSGERLRQGKVVNDDVVEENERRNGNVPQLCCNRSFRTPDAHADEQNTAGRIGRRKQQTAQAIGN
jgi:hypothetical protein